MLTVPQMMLNIIPVTSVCISTPAACNVTAASALGRKFQGKKVKF